MVFFVLPSATMKNGLHFTVYSYYGLYEIVRSSPSCGQLTGPEWSRNLQKNGTVCVECQQFAMRRHIGTRCRGHGLPKRETRWEATTAPGCRGTWILQSQHEEGTCNGDSQLSFIFVWKIKIVLLKNCCTNYVCSVRAEYLSTTCHSHVKIIFATIEGSAFLHVMIKLSDLLYYLCVLHEISSTYKYIIYLVNRN